MALKDNIIKKVAEKTELSTAVVEAVITHQFTALIEKMSTEHSVEISGFGKFLFLPAKAKRLVEGIDRLIEKAPPPTTPAEEKKLRSAKEDVEVIRQRLNQYNAKLKTDSRGVEKCNSEG